MLPVTTSPRPLSVVIPCYNEISTISQILRRVAEEPLVHEIIVVDDCSTDGTRDLLREISAGWPASRPPLKVVYQAEILQSIPLRSDRFGFEPEITAKIAKLGCRIYEVPISYHGRSYAEGKKIGWKDGLQALGIILKYWLINDLGVGRGELTLKLLQKASRYNGWVYQILRPYLGREILEVGSGIGNMTRYFLGHGQVTASDISPFCLRELTRSFSEYDSVKVRSLDISRNSYPELELYDTIVCLNVLEHIENDVVALKNM